MSILTASHLSQSFGAFDLFRGISVSIPNDGKIGLVGPNGVGKTTLLLQLAGLTMPSTGTIHMARGTRLGYLTQESAQAFDDQDHTVYQELLDVFASLRATGDRLRQMEQTMADGDTSDELFEQYSKLQEQFELAGGYGYELHIKQVLTGLNFAEDDWQLPVAYLSGGQKTRLLLAKLLLEKPDLLILDEPTNHLDVAAIEWLEGALKVWDGAILIVSHDRYFLDRVVNTIWEMSRAGIERYRGNYSAYVQQRQERWEKQQQAFDTLKERLDKEMDYIRRNIAGQRTQMAQGKLSRLSREVEAIHAGGLSVLGELKSKGWLQLSEALDMKRPSATVGELQQRINEIPAPSRPPTLSMNLKAPHRSGKIVLRTDELQVGYPDNTLFASDDIELHFQECAALIGPNGTGKTTFLKTILENLPPIAGEVKLGASLQVAYFAQAHDSLNLENTVLDELLNHTHMMTSEARSYLARFLFRGDDVYKRIESLSGGERGRLALALLALEGANFLLLDEPTNHLDIPSQESLQASLEQFGGTILMVSHDRYLVDRLASQIWHLDNGRLQVFNGPYQEFLAWREAEKEAVVAEKKNETPTAVVPEEDNRPRLSKNELRKQQEAIHTLETTIHETEEKLVQLSEAIQEATQAESFDKIQTLSLTYAETESDLERLMISWEKLLHE